MSSTTTATSTSTAAKRVRYPIVPFDDSTPTHPLLIVDYQEIVAGKQEAVDTLYKACSELGFFYLKNHGVDPEPVFELSEQVFNLPLDELMKFEQGDSGMSAGFKYAGSTNVDSTGVNKDTAAFMNISKDDALHYPTIRQRTYPELCNQNMHIYTKFTRDSDDVLQNLMEALEGPLGLPRGVFRKLHPDDKISGSETRAIRKAAEGEPGYRAEGNAGGLKGASIGAHTDFGSLSFLHSRMTGGLQVLPPGTSEWQYIKPIEGHAVVNVGDTLAVYTGGIFNSNTHRVVPPPGEQGHYTRWSCVFFERPFFDAELYPLSHLSSKIAEAADRHPVMSKMERGVTAGAWFKRRVAGQRKGDWAASRGTEHTPTAV